VRRHVNGVVDGGVPASLIVAPLEPPWQGTLDRVLAPLSTRDVARLAPRLAALSQAYNAGLAEGKRTKLPLEARVAFSFPRDVPKGAAAVRELIETGALVIPNDRALRVLDLGAGLGAMTWGIVRALAAAGQRGTVRALFVDEDAEVLAAAKRVLEHAPRGPITLEIATRTASLAHLDPGDPALAADIVMVGQVLSEMDRDVAGRAERHAAMLAGLVRHHDVVVVVEPALKDRTRHLHAVRDLLREHVFAPCLHRSACPALADEDAWCHEDVPVDLPAFIVPLARAAGLRYEGLTFSYLVLRRDGAALPTADFRVVSDLLRSKGKVELFACTSSGVRRRLRLLDRDAGAVSGIPFDALRRGDRVTLRTRGADASSIDERGRVAPEVTIDVAPLRP
jgi:ribosomal protein RSM22 (predicted rRNA methylase)